MIEVHDNGIQNLFSNTSGQGLYLGLRVQKNDHNYTIFWIEFICCMKCTVH